MTIVDDLIAHPGLYIGKDDAVGRDLVGAARIVVSPLPGRTSVSLDYEIFNAVARGPVRGHVEHTVIGRTEGGETIMVVAHTHAEGLTMLHETDPGVFEQGDAPGPYPMKVVVSVPGPGRLRHAWWYGSPDEPLRERDVAELELVTE